MTDQIKGPLVSFADLPEIREKHKEETIVFCSGAFDLLHAGHVLFFEDCKRHGAILVVEVAHDALIRKHKGGNRPFRKEAERLKLVSSLRAVDYCFLDFPVDGDPLVLIGEVFIRLQPNIYVINNDAFNIPYRKNLCRIHGVRLVICDRCCPPEFEGVSTTQIITQIES